MRKSLVIIVIEGGPRRKDDKTQKISSQRKVNALKSNTDITFKKNSMINMKLFSLHSSTKRMQMRNIGKMKVKMIMRPLDSQELQ